MPYSFCNVNLNIKTNTDIKFPDINLLQHFNAFKSCCRPQGYNTHTLRLTF